LKIFIKIDFKETQVYHFDGVVNNQRVDDNPTVSENIKLLNENEKIEIYPVEEKINGFPKLKSNMEYPYNTFHLSFKFPNWSVFTGFQHIINPNEFSIKLEKRKIIISGKIVLGLSMKDNCFEDLKSNIYKCYVETVVVKKEINETTPHLNYNFSFTGDWEKDNIIRGNIIDGTDTSRGVNVEFFEKLPKEWKNNEIYR